MIARTKVAEQLRIMAAAGAAEDGFQKEHGGNGDVGAAVTQIEMLAMSDLSRDGQGRRAMGPVRRAIENLGTERHHEAYVQRIIDLDLLGCFAMTETGHGSDVQSIETTATYDVATQEFVIDSPTRTSRKDYIGGAAETARVAAVFAQLFTTTRTASRSTTVCTASWWRSVTTAATTCPESPLRLPLQGRTARCRQRPHPVRPCARPPREPAEQICGCGRGRHIHLADRKPEPPILHDASTLIRGRVTVGGSAAAAARVALTSRPDMRWDAGNSLLPVTRAKC